MPKDTLRDKIDGNQLDLSMSDMEIVPVKDLAAHPKATDLDLSNNKITLLPDLFCTLTHISILDLSKNLLTSLPRDFGNLDNLQHLDLLGNQLTTLPRSFCQLRRLRWLDLKDNPLEDGLKKNAGDCLDEMQCKKCATRILMYMKDLDSQLERLTQAKLKKKRDEEARKKQLEEQEAQRKRQEKKAEKARMRQEAEARRAQERLSQAADTSDEEMSKQKEKLKNNKGSRNQKKNQSGRMMTFILWSFFTLLLALMVAVDFHCTTDRRDPLCDKHWLPARAEVLHYWAQMKEALDKFYHTHIEKHIYG